MSWGGGLPGGGVQVKGVVRTQRVQKKKVQGGKIWGQALSEIKKEWVFRGCGLCVMSKRGVKKSGQLFNKSDLLCQGGGKRSLGVEGGTSVHREGVLSRGEKSTASGERGATDRV